MQRVKLDAYARDVEYDALIADEMRVDAMVRQFEIVGEAAKSVSETTCQKYPAVNWRRWKNIRNTLIQAYFNVDVETLWSIAKDDLPELVAQLDAILEEEYGPKN